MPKPIIEIKNLAKLYKLGQTHGGGPGHFKYKAFRDILADKLKHSFKGASRKTARPSLGASESIWALKDISFDIMPQETIGIVGKNGAGKTTLLKILSQITDPTQGCVTMRGRVASLLEVGTGFHPELTGRENIYLNGSILGMKRREIKKKFDQIVAFAGVDKFMDTPVKRYSTGMYVRLAFSVAAHLDVEILLVDEVLAVGDFEFQKKCLEKMEGVAKEGRTVLFVSHNLSAVQRFCKRAILLESGRLLSDGPTTEVVNQYLFSGIEKHGEIVWNDMRLAPGNEVVRIKAVRVKDQQGQVRYDFDIQEPVHLELEFQVLEEDYVLQDTFYLHNEAGQLILVSMNNHDSSWREKKRPKGIYRSVCSLPGNFLNEGVMVITGAVATNPSICHALASNIISFRINDPGHGGVRGNYVRPWPGGLVRPLLNWKTDYGL